MPDAAAPRVAEHGLGAVRALATDAAALFSSAERADLAALAQVALGRIDRPTALVCVVGEFKQGKSSLVNELVGEPICPVDDDLATSALTLVHYAPDLQARVHHWRDGQVAIDAIPPDAIAEWASEQGNPDNRRRVDRLEIGVPSRFLERGPALIDTPGTGGLNAGAATSVLAFLPFADALLFVTDASAELSGTELEFLRRAADRCPTVLLCLTKIDACPAWQRVAELDRAHLDRAGLHLPIVPVSSTLRGLALGRRDPTLNDESGFPALLQELDGHVLSRVKRLAAQRAAREVGAAAGEMAASYRTELEVLDDPARLGDVIRHLEAARERLDLLRGASARWQVVLNDRIADLGTDVTHRFRSEVRGLLRDADAAFEAASTTEQWKEMGANLQQRLGEAVGEIFGAIDDAHRDIRAEILELLRDEGAGDGRSGRRDTDLGELFAAATLVAESGGDGSTVTVGEGVDRGMNLVRGAYGAVMVFGLLGRLLPATAAAVLLSNPFTLGAGALFGIKHARDQRTKRVASQRQQARAAFRSAVEQIQVEVLKAITDGVRDVQRDLRDSFIARIEELQRDSTATAARCQAEAERGGAARDDRRARLHALLAELDSLTRRSGALIVGKV